jgi:S-adenosylmethionine synthetase
MACKGKHLFTSESVSMGHPDKVADQISDAVLDSILAQDPMGRVACETLVTTGLALIAGEITTSCYVDIPKVARQTIKDIGYTDPAIGFDYENCAVITSVNEQSPDIAQGVDPGGAGDQGMMFGYATDETDNYMPLPIELAHDIVEQLRIVREDGSMDYLRPDGKSQVTVEYDGRKPIRVHTIVVAAQHTEDVDEKTLQEDIKTKVLAKVIPSALVDDNTIYHINATGRFVEGGPKADCGLTGRKIIVDTYGGRGNHGGGAFSGKDPSKVDRSGAYVARHIAKNIVASGLADTAEVELAYAIGVPQPLSILVETDDTGKVAEDKLVEIVKDLYDLSPKGIIERFDLRRPIYVKTARHGHFGKNCADMPWEQLDAADDFKKAAGL